MNVALRQKCVKGNALSKRGYCCNLSVGVALNVRSTTNKMCTKNNTHINVARTSNNRVIMACNLWWYWQCQRLNVATSVHEEWSRWSDLVQWPPTMLVKLCALATRAFRSQHYDCNGFTKHTTPRKIESMEFVAPKQKPLLRGEKKLNVSWKVVASHRTVSISESINRSNHVCSLTLSERMLCKCVMFIWSWALLWEYKRNFP